MNRLTAFVGLICLALTACNGDQQVARPREPGPNALGYYCKMALNEHAGPKAQILPKGWPDPLWFSSVRDALTYVEQDIVSDREIAGFWVNDMEQGTWDVPAAGSWIEASKAWYVVGSAKQSTMGGAEAVPFKLQTAAEAFAKIHGGKVSDYLIARRHVMASPPPGLYEGTGR